MVLVVVSRLLGIYYIVKYLLLDLTASKKFDYIFLNDHVIYPMLRKNKVRQQGLQTHNQSKPAAGCDEYPNS